MNTHPGLASAAWEERLRILPAAVLNGLLPNDRTWRRALKTCAKGTGSAARTFGPGMAGDRSVFWCGEAKLMVDLIKEFTRKS